MTENSESVDFVLNILREISIEEEQSLFNGVADKTEIHVGFGDSMEDLRDPFDDLFSEVGASKTTPKKSMNAKYKELRSMKNRLRINTPDLLIASEAEEPIDDQNFEADMTNFMGSIGLEAYKAEKQRLADDLEEVLRKSKVKKKPPPKPKVQDDGDVESLTGFTKLAEMHERPKGFPITTHNYNILKDSEQMEWLQTKSVPSWNSREDSKQKCFKWLKDKT